MHDKDNAYTNYDNPNASQKGAFLEPTQEEIDAATNSIGFVNAVNAEGLCGAKDWTRPTIDNLLTLVDYGKINPSIDTNYFSNMKAPFYFLSASSTDRSPSYTWTSIASYMKEALRSTAYPARLVRTHNNIVVDNNRFEVYADGSEILDKQTNLIWSRCPVGTFWENKTCKTSQAVNYSFTHDAALKAVKVLAESSGKAWRLPNIRELQSIENFTTIPVLDSNIFPHNSACFWSSTPVLDNVITNGSSVWGICMTDVYVSGYMRSTLFRAMVVRSR